MTLPPTRGATRGASPTMYDSDEWLEIDNHIYDWFFDEAKHDELPVGPYGFYFKQLGRSFVCIQKTDDGMMLTAMSCMNMVVEDFHKLSQDSMIDEVIVALGYIPTPLLA